MLELWNQNDEELPRPAFNNSGRPQQRGGRNQYNSGGGGNQYNSGGGDRAVAETFPFCLSSLSLVEEAGGEPVLEDRSETRIQGRRAHFTIGKGSCSV